MIKFIVEGYQLLQCFWTFRNYQHNIFDFSFQPQKKINSKQENNALETFLLLWTPH